MKDILRTTFGVLLLPIVGIVGCSHSSPSQPGVSAASSQASGDVYVPSDPKGIRTTTVEQKAIPDLLQVSAKIEPDPVRVIRIFPPVGGRLISVGVRPGDHVQKGQVLAVLESSDLSAARADYEKARADAEVKEKALRRASMLSEHKVLAEKDYQQAQADEIAAQATLGQTLDRLRVLGVDPEKSSNRFQVLAPRSGVVLDIGAAPGEFSKSLDAPQPLCTLADLSSVWVLADIFEKDVAGLRAGAPVDVTVNAYPGQKWSGRIANVSDAVDATTRTLKVRVVLPNPSLRLKPEMFATLGLLRSSSNGLVIPASAVLREGANSYVFVQKAGNQFERRDVTIGRSVDGNVEVTGGLKAGEVVVSEGALLLRAAAQS